MATPRKSRAKAIPVPATFVAVAPSRPRARSKKVVPTDVVAVAEEELVIVEEAEEVVDVEAEEVVDVEAEAAVFEEEGNEFGREPVVLQLNIPDARMTEIVNYTSTKEITKVDPEPYAPGQAFTSMMNMEETAFKTIGDRGGGSHTMICYWCCHSIVDTEYGMPIRYDSVHSSFTLYGCFCSLECAAAHNFATHMGCDRAWEIHSWIQLMARRYGFSGRVRPAPSKYLLNIFNGPLTIEEFRNAHKGLARTYVQNIPPFIHISSQMEVLNTSFMTKAS